MYIDLNNNRLNIIISRKKGNKNTYLRVKEDLNIYVTTNAYTTDKEIVNIINNNIKSIERMYDRQFRINKEKETFTFLGQKYDIIYTNNKDNEFINNHLYLNKKINIDKFLKDQAQIIYKNQLDYWYHNFSYNIPYPKLQIRKMKSRWGVCNFVKKTVTLNLELIKYKSDWLDYVIVHELSHFIEHNHSNEFWTVVGENYPNYKKIRLEMKKQ